MKVIAITPRGYCKGVVNSIKIALDTKEKYNCPIYILGEIVHNKNVTNALAKLNIISLDISKKTKEEYIDEINEGVIILSAHGSSEAIKNRIKNKNLILVDSTCPFVYKSFDIIKEYSKNHDIIYVGKKNHEEALAAKSLNENKVHIIESPNEINNLNINSTPVVTNQTTMSKNDINEVFENVKNIYNDAILIDEQCNATSLRQNAILNCNEQIDLFYVVGDTNSNNSKKLCSLASKKAKTYLINDVRDINIEDLQNCETVAVTSGASTPTYLTNQVIDFLEKFNYNDINTHIKPLVLEDKILEEFIKKD